jgi:hypothetical protein
MVLSFLLYGVATESLEPDMKFSVVIIIFISAHIILHTLCRSTIAIMKTMQIYETFIFIIPLC